MLAYFFTLNASTMISNPARWFSGGGGWEHLKEFVYEGGDILYHFSSSDSGFFGNIVCINVVFFANNPLHAVDVLTRMLEMRQECAKAQALYYSKGNVHDAERILESNKNREGEVAELLANPQKWKITKAPRNQFYKIGWASNDTLF